MKVHGVNSEDWQVARVGDRVLADGLPGKVADVFDGPFPGTEVYIVTLDNNMGGGEYGANEITPMNERESSVERTAADDYPELGNILTERPPLAHSVTAGMKVALGEPAPCPDCGSQERHNTGQNFQCACGAVFDYWGNQKVKGNPKTAGGSAEEAEINRAYRGPKPSHEELMEREEAARKLLRQQILDGLPDDHPSKRPAVVDNSDGEDEARPPARDDSGKWGSLEDLELWDLAPADDLQKSAGEEVEYDQLGDTLEFTEAKVEQDHYLGEDIEDEGEPTTVTPGGPFDEDWPPEFDEHFDKRSSIEDTEVENLHRR